jgi:hypothetical protein
MRQYLKILYIFLYMSAEKIKLFNSIIEDFLAQTSELIGTSYYTYFKKVIKINSLIAIENSIAFLIPHKNKIFNKDESYFYDESNYLEDLNKTELGTQYNSDTILSEIFRLKNIYDKLDADSKENVWSILQALLQLTIEYCELKGIKHNYA